MQRRLILDSIENIRDLGGYSTANGQQTRWRSFLRADHFQSWTAETRQALVDYGVKLVIDLRTPNQISEAPNHFAQSQQVKYLNLPLLTNEVDEGQRFRSLIDTMSDNAEMYVFMLDECQTTIGSILTAMATHNMQTTLFHCFAGKDRTGIIAALLLSLAGADDEVIVQDYALTDEYLVERVTKVRTHAATMGEDTTRLDILFAASAQSMRMTLSYLREHHGGAQAYLQACGVSDGHVSVLRAMLLEDTP